MVAEDLRQSVTTLIAIVIKQKKLGRPPTAPPKLRDGFYVEIRRTGDTSAMKMRFDTMVEAENAIDQYRRTHDVNFYGKVKDGKVVNSK